MSLESSASLWDAISFWLVVAGAVLAGIGGVTSIATRRINRRLSEVTEAQVRKEKQENDRAIAEANARAQEASLELARFKAPRALTKEQQDRLVAKLNSFSGQLYSFNVTADPEATRFLQVLRTVLNNAGWKEISSQIGDVAIGGVGISTDTGIKVEVAANADLKMIVLAQTLDAALNAEGIGSVPRHNGDLKNPSAINILVGKKP